MQIRNTDVEAACDWPEDIFIQGGGRGLVLKRDGGAYITAFVEVCPPGTFLRGEGETIAEAEQAVWKKYTTWLNCDGTGKPHGPFEARQYENGAGYCTRCGAWLNNVLEPSLKYKCSEQAVQDVTARYGDDIIKHPRWPDLVKEEGEVLLAVAEGRPEPERRVQQPTEAELADLKGSTFTDEALASLFGGD